MDNVKLSTSAGEL